MNRREFLKIASVTAGASLAGSKILRGDSPSVPSAGPRPDTMVGMPISTAPLGQPGFEGMLDDMQKRGGVNALFPFIYTHEGHRGGFDGPGFRGGNFAIPHMQYYKDSGMTYEDLRAPEAGDADLLDRALALGHKRGIKTFAWVIEDNNRPKIPHWEPMYEIDIHGRRSVKNPAGRCFNNPLYRALTLGLMEDYTRSYPIDGIMWGSERQSGVLDVLNISQSSRVDPTRTTCFCEFCLKKGRDQGIDPERARQGFLAFEKFILSNRAGGKPRDGYFTGFWRILFNHPELLAWERLWVKSRHEFQADIYRRVKSINPALPVGWHIWSNRSFSPFQRAEEDYADLAPFSDFLRPALYNNCAGGRFRNFSRGTQDSLYGDIPPAEAFGMFCHQLGYNEAPYDKVAATGLTANYVEIETRNAVDGVAPAPTRIWPGVDIDVPVPEGESMCTPQGVKAAVKAVFQGGGHGILLSRNYIEMKPDHLSAAGDGLRELGLA
jgi:hypothetical protein